MEDIWLMDSDYCENCGDALSIRDIDGLCWRCLQEEFDEWDEEDDWYPGWGSDWDIPLEEVNKP